MTPQRELGEVTVRVVQPGEYDTVRHIWAEAGLPFRPQGRDHPEKVGRELMQRTAIFLLAEADGVAVGVVLGTHDGRKGWINRLAVVPAYRRRGIARLLVRELEIRLSALGLDITAALIESDNRASLGFFRAIGYVHDPDVEYVSKRRSAEV